MRAVPSQAFVADLRISRARFCLAVAVVAALFGALAAYGLWTAPVTGMTVAQFRAFAIPVAAVAAAGAFVFLLLVSAPVWWALGRLRLHGWASSLLAGGLLVMALCAVPMLSGRNAIRSAAPLWLLILGEAPFGLLYGWIIWRIAYRPAERPATPAPAAPPTDAGTV